VVTPSGILLSGYAYSSREAAFEQRCYRKVILMRRMEEANRIFLEGIDPRYESHITRHSF